MTTRILDRYIILYIIMSTLTQDDRIGGGYRGRRNDSGQQPQDDQTDGVRCHLLVGHYIRMLKIKKKNLIKSSVLLSTRIAHLR